MCWTNSSIKTPPKNADFIEIIKEWNIVDYKKMMEDILIIIHITGDRKKCNNLTISATE